MSTHTIKGFIYWQHNKYMKAPAFVFDKYDMRTWGEETRDGRVFVREHEFQVEVPDDFDPRPSMVAGLEAEKKRIRAEFAAKVKEIDTRIAQLLAIENNPTVVDA